MSLKPITCAELDSISHVRHGFFTRQGGVSDGIYGSLNCGYGSDDRPETVTENRNRVARNLAVAENRLLSLHQIHSNKTVSVNMPWRRGDAPEADAMITEEATIGLGILTADCAPVLICDRNRPLIAAAHAGWKGALTGILESTIDAFRTRGSASRDLVAAIGPCIHQPAYEVGPEFRQRFLDADQSFDRHFLGSSNEGRHLFDLPTFVMRKLNQLGVERVSISDVCTYTDEESFFSYRRATHRNEPDYGRFISAITLVAS